MIRMHLPLLLLIPSTSRLGFSVAPEPGAVAVGHEQQVAGEIASDLDKTIQEHLALLEGKDARIAGTWLRHAYTAARRLSEQGPEDLSLVNEFHNDEFIRAMTGQADTHAGTLPSGKESKQVRKVALDARRSGQLG